MKGVAMALVSAVCLASGPALAGFSLGELLARRAGWIEKSERAKPALIRRDVRPVRMVRLVEDAKAFQGVRMETVCRNGAVDGRAVSMKPPLPPLKGGDAFIFDFGEHLVGHFRFRLAEHGRVMDAPCRLKFTFAEVPGEFRPFEEKKWKGLCRSWFPDETLTFDFAPQDYELPRRYAFRYVKVEVVACPAGVPALEDVVARAETSADERTLVRWQAPTAMAAKIDRISLNTLRDCMQTMFEDGPKRDRRLWLGDLRLEALANYETYRNFAVVKRSLYLLAGTAKDNGLVGTDAYERPFPKKGACRIYDYTALFPQTVLEYLEASGDRETAEDLWPLCKHQFTLLLKQVGEDGLVHLTGDWWYFIDHATLDRQVPEQGVMIFGLKGLANLAKKLGRESEVAFARPQAEKMAAAARGAFWDARRGLFVAKGQRPSWLGQAWMTLAGVPTGEEAARALVAVQRAGTEADAPRTPYGYHYMVEALYAAGLRDKADALLLSYWGGMVEKGADTFWEAFVPGDDAASPYGNTFLNSACHAWSAAPSYFLRNPRYRALTAAVKYAP